MMADNKKKQQQQRTFVVLVSLKIYGIQYKFLIQWITHLEFYDEVF